MGLFDEGDWWFVCLEWFLPLIAVVELRGYCWLGGGVHWRSRAVKLNGL